MDVIIDPTRLLAGVLERACHFQISCRICCVLGLVMLWVGLAVSYRPTVGPTNVLRQLAQHLE